MRITLVQPKYPHGGADKCQTYLPGGLMNIGSRLLQAGVEVEFLDLNHVQWSQKRDILDKSNLIGFTALGAPHIPDIIETVKGMREAGLQQPVLVGGEGINRLEPAHFAEWFKGLNVHQVKSDCEIASACGINPSNFLSAYETSMEPMLQQLDPKQLRGYLTSEFALFMSQGCAFNCHFCAAAKAQKEQYRSCESLADELRFVCHYLRQVNHHDLRVYITNLDAFQTPEKLEERLIIIRSIADEFGITPHVRCLATSRCTFHACRKDPDLPKRLRSYGLEIVAFGADGADEETWRQQNKTHNSLSELQTVCKAMEKAKITVELLMVIGFQGSPWIALWHGLKFSIVEAFKGRVIRPYLAKSQTPSGPWPADNPLVQAFVKDPSLLVRLDYAMVGSKETHPRWLERWAANAVYLTIITLLAPFGKCPTRPLFPTPKGIGRWLINLVNKWMPFDR